ncbi:periplasmic nitrate reductase chaperone NapD [Mesobacillus persicus]|uniref:Chaperone NapD n=1 Tax=Mesobacillus persicus TaxID=930146 RepID=A0A1H8EYQ7_9BACI|nr:chaperone NapD [Mesobacillus persicus]SEN24589.1 periplasmic nitrate reductase chaperone NapD [Mesobacillus persicus]
MVISGLYIETVPGRAHGAANSVAQINGVEIHHIEENHKIVLTIEAETVDQSYQISDKFKHIDGVLMVCLVYNHFEEDLQFVQAVSNQ